MGNRRDFRNVDLAVLGIVLVGAVLRIWGIGFGLPIESNLYIRPDESLLIEPGLHFFERWGDPLFYVYPALVMDFVGVLFKILFQVWQSLGLASGDGMLADFAAAPSAYFLAIRWISVIAGTAGRSRWDIMIYSTGIARFRTGSVQNPKGARKVPPEHRYRQKHPAQAATRRPARPSTASR